MYPTSLADKYFSHKIYYYIFLTFLLGIWLFPLMGIIFTSLKTLEELNSGQFWSLPPLENFFINYSIVFKTTPMLKYLLNSLIISIPSVIGSIFLASLAGFALAKYQFPFQNALFALFILGNFIPFQIIMIPVRNLILYLNLFDTFWALILFHMAFQVGFCTLFMRNFITQIPDEFIESARIEGISEGKIYLYIILPLIRPAIAALSVLVFTFIWNDFFWSLILVQNDAIRPVTTGLNSLKGQWLASWQLISAGSLIAAIPPITLFFLMQRHFVTGLTLGAKKG